MTYLVDANVLSEPTKPEPEPRVVAWLRSHSGEMAVDPVILGELSFGILRLPRGRRKDRLERWFESAVQKVHCVPWEAETGLRWALLVAELRASGQSMPIKDSFIAATALVHGLTLVTRNRRDFERAGVKVENPFETG